MFFLTTSLLVKVRSSRKTAPLVLWAMTENIDRPAALTSIRPPFSHLPPLFFTAGWMLERKNKNAHVIAIDHISFDWSSDWTREKKLRKRVILHTQKTLIAISSAMVQKLALLLQIRRTLSLWQFASKYSLFSLDRNLWCAICQLYTASRQRHVTQHAVLQSQTKKHLSFLFDFLRQILLFGWKQHEQFACRGP